MSFLQLRGPRINNVLATPPAVNYTQNLTGSLSFSGSIAKRAGHALTAAVSFVGALAKVTVRPLTGSLSFVGSIAKSSRRALSGALTFSGGFLTGLIRHLSLSSTMAFNNLITNYSFEGGSGTTNANFSVPGWAVTIPAAATVVSVATDSVHDGQQAIKVAVDAGNSNNGIKQSAAMTVLGNTTYTFTVWVTSDTAGALQIQFRDGTGGGANYVQTDGTTWSGVATYQSISTTTSWAQYSFTLTTAAAQTQLFISDFKRSGVSTQASRTFWIDTATINGTTLFKRTSYPLTAGLTFVGNAAKQTVRALTASLSFVGSFVKRAGKAISGALTFSTSFSRAIRHALTAALTFSGNINRRVNRALTASLSFVTAFIRALPVSLTAAITFSGSLGRGIRKNISSSLSFVGTWVGFITPIFTFITAIVGSTTQTGSLNDSDDANVNSSVTIENVSSPSTSVIEAGEDNTETLNDPTKNTTLQG